MKDNFMLENQKGFENVDGGLIQENFCIVFLWYRIKKIYNNYI